MSASAILAELQAARADILTLKAQVSALQTAIDSKPAAAAVGSSDGKKERKTRQKNPDAARRPAGPWVVFVNRVRELLRSVTDGDGKNAYTAQDLGINCVQFASALKEENADLSSWSDADIIARRAAWTRPSVSKQEAAGKNKRKTGGSVASAPAADELDDDGDGGAASADSGKKRGPAKGTKLTDEQKAARSAKAAATRAAKKGADPARAAIQALGDAGLRTLAAAPSVSNAAAPSSPKPAAPSAAGAGPAAAGGAAPADDERPKNVLLNVGGKQTRFLVYMSNGHAYNVLKDAEGVPIKGDDGKYTQTTWAGIFHQTGGQPNGGAWLDRDAPEPSADDDDEELNFDA